MSEFSKGTIIGALLIGFLFFGYKLITDKSKDITNEHNAKNKIILVDKQTQKLTVYDAFYGPIKTFDVSTGENPGNKFIKGDLKTPEGVFPIIGVEDASDWTYDFNDGKGPVEGAYGPLFIRLKVDFQNIFNNLRFDFKFTEKKEFTGIGIHGTNRNDLIGKRASHGCIRLRNEDLIDLKKYLEPGSLVLIIPGKLDLEENLNLKYKY